MPEAMERMLEFLAQLRMEDVHHSLAQARTEAIMVVVHVARERWEVEFFADGSIDVERFVASGDVRDGTHLRELWRAVAAERGAELVDP